MKKRESGIKKTRTNNRNEVKPAASYRTAQEEQNTLRASKEIAVELRGGRLEYSIIPITKKDELRLKREGILLDSLDPYGAATAFDVESDSGWIIDSITARVGRKKIPLMLSTAGRRKEDYRKANHDYLIFWIEVEEVMNVSVIADQTRDIVLQISSVTNLRFPGHDFRLSNCLETVRPSRGEIEILGGSGGGGDYKFMYVQKSGKVLDLDVDHETDPQGVVLRSA